MGRGAWGFRGEHRWRQLTSMSPMPHASGPTPYAPRLTPYALLLLLAACAAADRPQYTTVRDTLGDTVVVRNLTGSVWGDSVRVVEELRIGNGRNDTISGFGRIESMAVREDGTVAIMDATVPALRLFDAKGRYAGTLGRGGLRPRRISWPWRWRDGSNTGGRTAAQ